MKVYKGYSSNERESHEQEKALDLFSGYNVDSSGTFVESYSSMQWWTLVKNPVAYQKER
jgi:hypothetical protein